MTADSTQPPSLHRGSEVGWPEELLGLIDLHCHILPGIDDGALDLDDSLGMARQAEADGVEVNDGEAEMFKKIIVGHDRHDGGDDALALGRAIATATHAEVVVAKVFPHSLVPYGADADWREHEAEALAERVRRAGGEEARADVRPSTSPGRGLYELAEEIGADLIVIGSSRRGTLDQVLVGNVGLRLLHGSSCPVAVAPRGYRERAAHLQRITVGFNGSDEAWIALDGAFELSSATGAPVLVVGVAPPPPVMFGKGPGAGQGWPELKKAIEENVREHLKEARAAAPEDAIVDTKMLTDNPAVALAESTDPNVGILLLGSRGYGPLKRVLLGSVSAELARSARSPVLVFPRGGKDAAAKKGS